MSDLKNALKKVIGGTFSGIHSYYLQYLMELVGYYSEDDLTEAERNAINQMNAVLHKYAEINHLISSIHYAVKDGTNDISSLLEMKNCIMEVDTFVDIASLLCYVKRKAVKAGDWPITDE